MSKIAIIAYSLDGGGAERVAVNLANYYVSNKFEVDLVLFKKRGPYLPFVNQAVNIVDLNARTRQAFFRTRNYLKKNSDTLILSVIRDSNIVVGLASLGLKVKSITYREASTMDAVNRMSFLKRAIYRFLMKTAYFQADAIIANSEDTRKDLIEQSIADAGKIGVVVNPVLPINYQTLSTEPIGDPWLNDVNLKVILAVGRLQSHKNFGFLIDTFKEISEKEKQARLLIVGEGDEKPELMRRITALGLADAVKIIDFQDNIFPYYVNAHVFALTSKWEGFGNVIVEALSVGTPVIATDCPGGPKMILENGKYGRLIPMNDKAQYAQALLDELSKAKQINTDLVERAKMFAVEKVAHKYLSVMVEASSKRKGQFV